MTKTINDYKVHEPYVNPAHTAEKSSTQEKADRAKTTQQMHNIEGLLKGYNERGIEKFFNPGGLEQGVHALAAAKHVMLSTGFNVEEGMPETDGPPGLAALANALIETGKTVTFVTDSTNKPLIKACLDVLNPNAAKYCRFETFDVKPEQVAETEGKAKQLLALREAEIKAEKKANELLDKYNPDLVFTLELAGRGKEGVAKNMRGKNITGFNAMVDEVLNQANKRKITTVSVGDGGNEAGMGGLKGVPNAKNNEPMQARTKAGVQVTSWNSNLGGEALAAGVLAKYGKLDKLHTPTQQTQMIQAVVDNGGVDGVTRGRLLGVPSTDTDGRPVQTGVDGFDPVVHQGMLLMLKNMASMIPADYGLIAKAAVKEKPFQIAAFDSGAGGLVAAKNLAAFIKYRSNHNARFIAISDFAKAPYGQKSRQELVHLVGMGLKTAEALGTDVCAMACNTANTVLEIRPGDKPGVKPGDLKMPVIDLIGNTAEAIASKGGSKPVVLSTEATAKDDMYENRIKAAALELGKAEGKNESEIKLPEVVRLGAGDAKNEPGKDWASYINKVMHLSEKPEDKEEFTRVLHKFVDQIPKDATSVWLCCTHYPAIKDAIQERLKEKGLNIEVHDPMEYQAEAIIRELDKLEAAEKAEAEGKGKKGKGKVGAKLTDRSNRTDDTTPLVITSGKLAEATNAAKHLLQSKEGARLLSAPLTGEKFNMELIAPHMFYDLKSPSTTSFNSKHSLWKIPAPGDKDQEPQLLAQSSPPVSDKEEDWKSVKSITVTTPKVVTPTGSLKDFSATIVPTDSSIQPTQLDVDMSTSTVKLMETHTSESKKVIQEYTRLSQPQVTSQENKPKLTKPEQIHDLTQVTLSGSGIIPESQAGKFGVSGIENIPESAAGKFGVSGIENIPLSAASTILPPTNVATSSYKPSGEKPTMTSEKPILSSVVNEKTTKFFGTQPLDIEKFKTYQEPDEIEKTEETPGTDESVKSKEKTSFKKKFFKKLSLSKDKDKDAGKDNKDGGTGGTPTKS